MYLKITSDCCLAIPGASSAGRPGLTSSEQTGGIGNSVAKQPHQVNLYTVQHQQLEYI